MARMTPYERLRATAFMYAMIAFVGPLAGLIVFAWLVWQG